MESILLVAALLPAIVLIVYVYRHDKVESEPVGLVARVFFLGAASGIVAGIIEGILIGTLEAFMDGGLLMIFIEYFICVAAVEEACKYACLNSVKRHPAFDYVFDAIVYSVAAALGFAALENVLYVFDGGLETALVRAILSVPGHAADGVVMGVFFGLARQRELRGNKAGARTFYWLAFLLPTIEHGFYDAALSLDSDFMALVAVVFDLAFIVVAFVLVKRTSSKDAPLQPQAAPRVEGGYSGGATLGGGPSGAPESPSRSFDAGAFVAGVSDSRGVQTSNVPRSDSWQQSSAQGMAQSSPAAQAPSQSSWACPQCGAYNGGNFCTNCGRARPQWLR